MSESYIPKESTDSAVAVDGSTFPVGGSDGNSTMDTAKQEAREVKDTAKNEAGHVVQTAKDEAGNVVSEVKYQARDLFAQAQRELKDQASTQQTRLAGGLQSVGDDLRQMAQGGAPSSGIAADLVRGASTRVSSAASWLTDRDPSAVLADVKSYARRNPGMFIGVAALAGVVVGRLTRSLAAANAERSGTSSTGRSSTPTAIGDTTPLTGGAAYTDAAYGAAGTTQQPYSGDAADTPLYTETAAATSDDLLDEGGNDVRRDSF
ncbi:hypothetical protein [Microbacterium sp. CFBP9034]|uniref:hypothetical protein n=1 Tax=Microbacterium sp. CFBP9034 TaxID=3096540 RepID=UPI002A6B1479|nr:hypothetical protein [Microbacterium sp. CFBP9034]MDY0908582.1 hypothetical protein [Microbacterium sp. CFBP9034]